MTANHLQTHQLLVVDDVQATVELIEHVFSGSEISVIAFKTARSALEMIAESRPDVVMLDVALPDADGLEVFERIKAMDSQLPVVIMTGGHDGQTGIKAMQLGAIDYLVKPLDARSLNKVVRRAIEVRRLMAETVAIDPVTVPTTGASMIGCSPAMQEVFKAIGRVASQNISVLIRGESGTGKELVARAIFQNGSRKNKPFVAINCAAIPESLLESELFGHEKGAFTGADRKRIGKVEQCAGGTLFLDEIGDMEASLQSKILRVLQEKQFERVGGSETIAADVRILAATHRDIEKMCQQGSFREDLYYRLNGYTIYLPPLRDRNGDIELLIEFFRRTANRELHKQITRIDPQTIQALKSYPWPGNVRQLQSVIQQAVVQSSGNVLLPDFLPPLKVGRNELDEAVKTEAVAIQAIQGESQTAAIESNTNANTNLKNRPDGEIPGSKFSETLRSLIHRHCSHHSPTLYDDVIEEVERQLIAEVLCSCGGNLTEAAKRLGITRTTIRSKINKLGIGIRRVVE